ncbi:MAG: hypothetical protein KBC00_01355 [Candidatus Levybacteria bacterium]|nr:hypothetical protein [Candidatus Levybacteria bacterium]MBP9814983.1 hypothetical protein [Candidatus Levybacteria bacterium]
MGKVKIKVIGDEQQEQQEIEKNKAKREQKDLREGKKSAHVAGMKGGERTTTVGVSEEEISAQLDVAPNEKETSQKKEKAEKKARVISKRHIENKKLTDTTPLNITRSIEKLRKFKASSFDETVELHINTREKGISGTVVLPHGTGKKLNIKIADDQLITEIEKGKISFDVLVAHPSVMPKLAKVAKILGPRGLMPNPKNGTISTEPEKAAEKLSAGQIGYKTESTAPIIHLSVGKLSFEDKKIADNITTVLSAIGNSKINSVILKSTMSPAVKISL